MYESAYYASCTLGYTLVLFDVILAQGPQRSDAGEARTRSLSISSLPLSHCAST